MSRSIRDVQGDDGRFRVSGVIKNPTNLAATSANALVFSLHFDSDTKLVPTQSCRLKYNRTDNINSIFTSYVYLRKIDAAPLTPQAFFKGGAPRYGAGDVVIESRVETRARNTICNAQFVGINGWVDAAESYRIARSTTGEIFQDIKIPFAGFLEGDAVYELALVIGASDASIVTGSFSFDFVETHQGY